MKIQQFLDHHGIAANPFADEDAQTDLVFKGACIRNTFHPTWDKIYGDPSEPATAVVFGEKGSGKTAIRLQLARHLTDYNADHPDHQVFVVQYDDFNPFLDRFRDRFSGQAAAGTALGAMAAVGPHGRHPLAGRHPVGRSHPGSEAGPASRGPRRAAGSQVARCGTDARRDAFGRVLRSIDGRKPAAAMAPPAAKIAILHLAIEVGPGPGRLGYCGRDRLYRVARRLVVAWPLATLCGNRRRLGRAAGGC